MKGKKFLTHDYRNTDAMAQRKATLDNDWAYLPDTERDIVADSKRVIEIYLRRRSL